MVPKIRRGSRTHGLLVYLYGPGKRDEHTDPHLVGSWDGFAPDPGRDTSPDSNPKVTLSRLAAALDLRVKQAGTKAPAEHVWHCSVRTDPGDRTLTDAEWNTVARRLVQAVNLAPTATRTAAAGSRCATPTTTSTSWPPWSEATCAARG